MPFCARIYMNSSVKIYGSMNLLILDFTSDDKDEYISWISVIERPKTSPMRRHNDSLPSPNENMSFDEIRICLSEGTLTKNQMISIAERQFGLTKGTLLKLKKEEIKNKIESAMQNIETLKMIQKKAVEWFRAHFNFSIIIFSRLDIFLINGQKNDYDWVWVEVT